MRISPPLVSGFLLLACAGSLAAQGGGTGGGGRHGGHRGGGSYTTRSDRSDLITDPVIWDGPPSFIELPQTVQLSPGQKDQYNAAYDSFMVATKRVRDQARANRSAMLGSGPGPLQGGSDAAGGGVAPSASVLDDLKQEGQYLSEKQSVFDKTIQTFFSRARMKEYKKWRKQQRNQADAEQHQGGGSRGSGGPPS